MDEIMIRMQEILNKKKNCHIATTNNSYVDNAVVAFYADGLTLYFGAFSDTLKGRFIEKNNQVAVCIDELQIHGHAFLLDRDSDEYKNIIGKYLKKFPYYAQFFEFEKNELYKIKPLIVWLYDYHKGMMHRDKVIINQDYYDALNPYEPPQHFKRRIITGRK